MLSGVVTKAVNHCHSISSYPYFHINTKLALCTGAPAHKRYRHVLMLSVVAGVCHPVSRGDSTVHLVPLAPTAGVTPAPVLLCGAGGLNTPSCSRPEGPLQLMHGKNLPPKVERNIFVMHRETHGLGVAVSASPGNKQNSSMSFVLCPSRQATPKARHVT